MNLHAMGMNIRHEDAFFIDRPTGSGDNLLIIFKSDARVITDGDNQNVKPGSFILYTRNTAQRYGAVNKPYANHYIHFWCEDEEFFRRIGVVTDRPYNLQNLEEVENIIRLLGREFISESDFHKDNIDLLMQLLFMKMAENQCEVLLEENDMKHLEELTVLRSEIYNTPDKFRTIKEMAREVNLSLSYFQALYKRFFSVSCYEDLMNARISSGKNFLRSSNLSIREIANLCGYDSDTCFMRCFKRREGMTPSEYRSMHMEIH